MTSPSPLLHAAPPGTSLVVLCRRRGGARSLYDMLANHTQLARLGHEPFHWERPLGEVSKLFHIGQPEQARAQLDEALSMGIIFRHPYDTESWGFNSLVLGALKAHRARAILFERDDESERLFSLVVAVHFGLWTRDAIETFRERLRRGASGPAVDLERVRKLVKSEMQYQAWLNGELAATGIDVMRCSYEKLFRNGVHALGVADELFAFAGLGSRVSQLDDASFLRVAFGGEQHTLGLLDYSAELREVYAVILAAMAEPLAPPPPPTAVAAAALQESAAVPAPPAPHEATAPIPDTPPPPPETDRAY